LDIICKKTLDKKTDLIKINNYWYGNKW